jgi:hypothetical protein
MMTRPDKKRHPDYPDAHPSPLLTGIRLLARLLPLLKQYPAENMEEWRVGDEARNPKNDYPELIKKG